MTTQEQELRTALQYAVDILTPGRTDGLQDHHIKMFLKRAHAALSEPQAPKPSTDGRIMYDPHTDTYFYPLTHAIICNAARYNSMRSAIVTKNERFAEIIEESLPDQDTITVQEWDAAIDAAITVTGIK